MIGVTGCKKNSGEPVVFAKGHIAAAMPIGETLNA
jgi:hypothetical protein